MMQPTGVVPPPMPPMPMNQQHPQQQQQQQQHPQQYQQQPPPPQQWMITPPPQQYFQPQPPSMGWAQQPPQAAAASTPQQMQALQTQPQQYAAAPTSSDEIRSLWIGDLQPWMDENYVSNCFYQTGEVTYLDEDACEKFYSAILCLLVNAVFQILSVKVIRNKQTYESEGYGFLEFRTRAAAEIVLQTYNGTPMPNAQQNFRLNWATLGAGERRADDTADYTIFVGDLSADVTDYVLQETFKSVYTSVKGAKVVTDRNTGRSKGYGFVRFGDEGEQMRAMTEMNGVYCSSRPMRIGPAATKKPGGGQQQYQKASYQNPQGNQGESDPNNTTIFVGGLDPNVTDDHLRQVFGQYGELVHVKIPVGKRCGFVQFATRACAEQALSSLNGSVLGGQNIRLSWGRSPSTKQAQPDQTPWNGGYYGYTQGYEAYGYAPPPQDPNMYFGGGYPGYGNYQQPQQ
ncbi:unnamed protein product [Ilex paraguariensis]|uniref:RRM domain-containing protein n=1 Tax=Ilex paraguariensis TaxID=185542 RepID=A0ABC8U1H1_9AQUA